MADFKDPFFVKKPPHRKNVMKGDDKIIKLKLDFDPETGSTKINEDETVDLVALIQTYKDQCGMEYVQKLLRTGYATPDKFLDDGKHGGELPESLDINDAYRANLAATAKTAELSRVLGIDLSAASEADIAARLAEIYKTVQSAKTEDKEAK